MHRLDRQTAGIEQSYPIKVLQIGGGNFLRAFVDWMVSKMNHKGVFQGSVAVAKATPGGDYTELRQQQGLFHVAVRGIREGHTIDEMDLVSSVEQVLQPYDDFASFLKLAESDSLSVIVSNTTEAGIRYKDQVFSESEAATTFPALLTAFLWRRFQVFGGDRDKGLVILPCELIEANGDQLKEYVVRHGKDWKLGEVFLEWVVEANTFANTLVDRIVPGYPGADAAELNERTGFDDQLLVAAEPYHIWVIQADRDVESLFPLAKAGLNAVYTNDLTMYRQRKVRILNGAHTSMVPVGLLAGIETVGEFVGNPDMEAWLVSVLQDEIMPTLDYDNKMLQDYMQEVLDRFRNPFVEHKLSSIALNSFSKFRTRILPSLLAYVELKNEVPSNLALSLAAMIRLYEGSWKGEKVALKDGEDVLWFCQNVWAEYRSDKITLNRLVGKTLAHKPFWGLDLSEIDGLEDQVTDYLYVIENKSLVDHIIQTTKS